MKTVSDFGFYDSSTVNHEPALLSVAAVCAERGMEAARETVSKKPRIAGPILGKGFFIVVAGCKSPAPA